MGRHLLNKQALEPDILIRVRKAAVLLYPHNILTANGVNLKKEI